MKKSFVKAQKDGQGKEDSLHKLVKDRELPGDNDLDSSELKSNKLVRRGNPHRTLFLNVKQLRTSKSYIKDLLLQNIRGLDNKIPKRMVTLDEKYLRHCMELIHISASQAAPCDFSVNLSSVKMGIFSNGLISAKIRSQNTCDLGRFVFECPLTAGTGSLVISPAGQWIVGSIMGSKSMMNILKSPWLRQLGAWDDDANFRRTSLNNVEGSICYDFMQSPGGSSNYSLQKLQKETLTLKNHKYRSETANKRFISMSSTNSTCSDRSSSSNSASVSQGMLQCTWKGGSPHFVFSVDDQKEVYVAKLWKAESADDKALDYMYLFHSRKGGQKEREIHDNDSHLVGKMNVSTSFTLCPNNSKIIETQFILFGGIENYAGEMQSSRHNHRNNKGLSKKVVDAFRTSNSSKQRSTSRFGGSSVIQENYSWEEPCQDKDNNFDALGGANLLENNLPPNLELAAIVVKDHLPKNRREEVGGWGLKFLKKVGVSQTIDVPKASLPSTCCARDAGECSTSMDILVPAGLHGGPRTRNGGPSSLIERWRSGGQCDCGGWDMGCPLKVLKTRSNKEEDLPLADMEGKCKFYDLFIQGSKHGAPTLRIVNVHDGLYFVHFQSSLSALQSFSIAVAFIHNQSPTLRPRNVLELK